MCSWLLRDPNMQVRSMYFGFTKAVNEYYKQVKCGHVSTFSDCQFSLCAYLQLMHEIADLQYQHGGPIIAFQIENEYGSYGKNVHYLHFLKHVSFVSVWFVEQSPNTRVVWLLWLLDYGKVWHRWAVVHKWQQRWLAKYTRSSRWANFIWSNR